MKELSERRVASSRNEATRYQAFNKRVQSLTPERARGLFEELKTNPQDGESYMTLLRYYEKELNIPALSALKLWFIEHHPGGRIQPGNINPRHDRAAYAKGKALWLAQVKRNPGSIEIHQRAADFLGGGDKPLAEKILLAGRAANPNNDRWAHLLTRHYTHVIHGATEPYTEYNVFRTVSAEDAHSAYARDVIARLDESTDVQVLTSTAVSLLRYGVQRRGTSNDVDAAALARRFIERALAVEPDSQPARRMEKLLQRLEMDRRMYQFLSKGSTEQTGLSTEDQFLRALALTRHSWSNQQIDRAETNARAILRLAERHRDHSLHSEALFEAEMVLGKIAFRKGDTRGSIRHLLTAGTVPGEIRRDFDMNLPRALVDADKRSAVAQFLEGVAPKMPDPMRYRAWAAEIRKGINPDLIPTFTPMNCTNDPC
jgi:hypothetical protein